MYKTFSKTYQGWRCVHIALTGKGVQNEEPRPQEAAGRLQKPWPSSLTALPADFFLLLLHWAKNLVPQPNSLSCWTVKAVHPPAGTALLSSMTA